MGGTEERNMAINLVITALIAIAVFALLGGSILTYLGKLSQSGKQSGTDVRTMQMCNYKRTGIGLATWQQTSDGMALDKLALSLLDCFNPDERRELQAAGGPKITAADSCPSVDADGLNIFLLGPSESQYIWSGKSYQLTVQRVGPGTYPDACLTLEMVS